MIRNCRNALQWKPTTSSQLGAVLWVVILFAALSLAGFVLTAPAGATTVTDSTFPQEQSTDVNVSETENAQSDTDFVTYGFENEPADSGVPENFEAVSDPSGRDFTRQGTDEVTDTVAYGGSQSYQASESASDNNLPMRPAQQPYATPQTGNVSVALRGAGKEKLILSDGLGELPEITLSRQNGNLLHNPEAGGSARTQLVEADPSRWMEITVFDIDPDAGNYDVHWEMATRSGTIENLPLRSPMDGGYTNTVLLFDSYAGATRGYFDNLRVPTEASGGTTTESAATVSYEPSPAAVGEAVTFTPNVTAATPANYTWQFGDGTTATSTTATISHNYTAPGTYRAALAVATENGSTLPARTTVRVRSAWSGPEAYSFENEAGDYGTPARFEAVTDPKDNGFSREGTEEIIDTDAAHGDQSYRGMESQGDNALPLRPATQPYAEPITENVSVSFRGTSDQSLQIYETTGENPEIDVFRDNGDIVSIAGGERQTIAAPDPDDWARITVFDIDPRTDTFDLRWETSDDSGIVRNLAMRTPMTDGYTSTIISINDNDGRGQGYVDNLHIGDPATNNVTPTVTNTTSPTVTNTSSPTATSGGGFGLALGVLGLLGLAVLASRGHSR